LINIYVELQKLKYQKISHLINKKTVDSPYLIKGSVPAIKEYYVNLRYIEVLYQQTSITSMDPCQG
jgi:hypothetical protein